MSLKIFLDLDRTLYRTDLGTQLIWQRIASKFSDVDASRELGRQSEFYVHEGNSYPYNMRAHLVSLGLEADQVYEYLRRTEIADGRLEYEGVGELVSWARSAGEVSILTYGYDDYQRLKAALCPSIADLGVITTLKPKGDFLRTIQGDAWLVDDKPVGNELPANVRFIQVVFDRAMGSKDTESIEPMWLRADSLFEALKMLQNS